MKKNSALWASTSVLVGVVIAMIALLHNTRWEFPLLVITVGVWLAWLGFTRALPAIRAKRARAATEEQRRQAAAAPSTAQLQMLLRMLLQHVNYRVSDCLKSAYPDARWEWCMRDPAGFVARGGTGRIRVYGIPDYSYADVTLGQNGKDVYCRLCRVGRGLRGLQAGVSLRLRLCAGPLRRDPGVPAGCVRQGSPRDVQFLRAGVLPGIEKSV